MDPIIIAAIITAIGAIIAAFISQQRGGRNQENTGGDTLRDELPPKKNLPIDNIPRTHISKQFAIGVLLVVICSILFGGSHVLGKYVITAKSDPILVVTIRNIIAGLVIFVFSLILKGLSQEKNINIKYTKDSFYMVVGRSLSGAFYFATFL